MKQNKTNQETPKKSKSYKLKTVGIMQLFVIVSIAYMAYVVILGTDGIVPKVMCAPALIWATLILVLRFTNTK